MGPPKIFHVLGSEIQIGKSELYAKIQTALYRAGLEMCCSNLLFLSNSRMNYLAFLSFAIGNYLLVTLAGCFDLLEVTL